MKHYQRNRTETLSLRLTPEEKKILKSLAAKNGMSITDYILLSALQYSSTGSLSPALKLLDQIHTELLELQKEKPGDAVCDALEKQAKLYDAALSAIRST